MHICFLYVWFRCCCERERQQIARVNSESTVKKYKLQKYTQKAFGSSKKRNATFSVDLCTTVKRKESCAAMEMKRKVRSFLTMLAV